MSRAPDLSRTLRKLTDTRIASRPTVPRGRHDRMTASIRVTRRIEARAGSAAKLRLLGTAVALMVALAGCTAAPGGAEPAAPGTPAGESESSERPFDADDD